MRGRLNSKMNERVLNYGGTEYFFFFVVVCVCVCVCVCEDTRKWNCKRENEKRRRKCYGDEEDQRGSLTSHGSEET